MFHGRPPFTLSYAPIQQLLLSPATVQPSVETGQDVVQRSARIEAHMKSKNLSGSVGLCSLYSESPGFCLVFTIRMDRELRIFELGHF
jgi:hypothetical protein